MKLYHGTSTENWDEIMKKRINRTLLNFGD